MQSYEISWNYKIDIVDVINRNDGGFDSTVVYNEIFY